MGQVLDWGYRYLAVSPSHFRIDYAINPFMDPHDQPDPARARAQWEALIATITRLGGIVDILDQRADAPDMVYAMNLGLGMESHTGDPQVVLSHMRYPQRRVETETAGSWLTGLGYRTSRIGRDGVGAHFEAGDAFAFGGELIVGHGPRTDAAALDALAAELGIRVRGVRLTHPAMYHLDLAFCPISSTRALVCPDAFDPESAEQVLSCVPEPLLITETEALSTFCANSIVVGRTVVMPGCPDRVRNQLEQWGYDVEIVDVGEFHKGGGSIRCLTNPVDVRIGRDLVPVPGGQVLGTGHREWASLAG